MPESFAVIGHRVWACGEAGSHVIGCEALIGCHLLQRGWISIAGVGTVGTSQQRPNGTASLFYLPESIASMLDFAERVERADLGERNEFTAIEGRYSKRQFIDGLKDSVPTSCGE